MHQRRLGMPAKLPLRRRPPAHRHPFRCHRGLPFPILPTWPFPHRRPLRRGLSPVVSAGLSLFVLLLLHPPTRTTTVALAMLGVLFAPPPSPPWSPLHRTSRRLPLASRPRFLPSLPRLSPGGGLFPI